MKRAMVRHTSLRSACTLIGGLVLAIESTFSCFLPMAFAEQSLPNMVVGYQSGKITSIYQHNFQIDGKTFSLAPDCVLLDRHGDPLTPAALREDVEVKYHLLKGTTDRIDNIVVFLPY
ncbi:MAG: hypothetical protein ABL983_01350 [Nitrospira sp.]